MMKICYFGDYDPEYSRNRVFIKSLREAGASVVECRTDSKSAKRYPELIRKLFALRGEYDVILVGYSLSRFVVPLAKIFGNKPVVWNPLFSLYDSWILDRKLADKKSWKAKYYFWLDRMACLFADGVILDTEESITFFSKTFHISRAKFRRVFVGTDEEVFYPREKKRNDTFNVHFHGNFIPFHGVEYIIRAAMMLQHERITFTLIGSGQTYAHDRALAESLGVKNIRFLSKVSYRELADLLSSADLALGVFGEKERVNRVIPNKIFEAVAMGIPVLTAESLAVKELFTDGASIIFCREQDPEDLAKKILILKNNRKLQEDIAEEALSIFRERASLKTIGPEILSFLEVVAKKK
jgi:glycosyltransferase involved in cell wall biosynthesis